MIEQLANLTQIKMDPGVAIILATVSSVLMVVMRSLPGIIWNRIVMAMTIRVTLDENQNMAGHYIFSVFNEWVSKNRVDWLTRIYEVNDEHRIVAGTGFNVIYFRKRIFWCYMNREKPQGTMHNPVAVGSYAIFTWKWNRGLIDDLIKESTHREKRGFRGMIYSEQGRRNNEGSFYPPYMKDQPQLVSKQTMEQLHAVFKKFLAGKTSYHEMYTAHKETLMLFGPPGTGKTNVIRHLCAFYNCDLVLIDPATIKTDSFAWRSWESRHNKGFTVFLVEDIDSNKAYWSTKKEHDVVGNDKLIINTGNEIDGSIMGGGTISDLLNALEGAESLDNCIVIMTTNLIDKLEASIYRVGRVDHLIRMDYISLNDAVSFLNWTADDLRYQHLITDERARELPAGTLKQLKYCKDVESMDKVLSGKELSLSLHEQV